MRLLKIKNAVGILFERQKISNNRLLFIWSIFADYSIGYIRVSVFVSLLLCIQSPIVAQESNLSEQSTINLPTAVVQGSLRQQELLKHKNQVINTLLDELNRLKKLQESSDANGRLPGDQTPIEVVPTKVDAGPTPQNKLSDGSTGNTENTAPVREIRVSRIELDSSWFVAVSTEGPQDYVDLMVARGINQKLPSEADCEGFDKVFEKDPSATRKLVVNGFPVTSFWIIRSSGKLGVCKVARVASGVYKARVSSLAPSRTEKALVARQN